MDPAELSPGEFVHAVRQESDDNEATVMVIDSFNGFMNGMPGEETLALQVHELLFFLTRRGVVVIMIMAQYGILGQSMLTPADISYLDDSVLLLRYFEAAGAVKQAISVVKKRSGNHERNIREFKLEPGGIRIGPALTDLHGILTGTTQYRGPLNPLMKVGGAV